MATDTLDTVATLQEFFKQPYSNYLGSDLPKESDLATMIANEGSTETCGGLGLDVQWAEKTGDGVGSGALAEGGAFPQPVSSSAFNYKLALTHRAYSVMWTGHSEAMGTSEKMSWINGIIEEKGQEIRDRAAIETARFMLHTGSAILGQVTAVEGLGANKYIVVDGASIHFYQKNQRLTARDLSTGGTEQFTGNSGNPVLVVDVDYVNGYVYMADTSGVSVGDYIAWANYYDATVPNGLQNLVLATGTIQNVTRTTVGYSASRATVYAYNAAVTALTPDILRDLIKNVARPRGTYKHTYVLHPTVRQWFSIACVGMNRFADMKFKVGVRSVTVATERGDQEWTEDANLPTGKFWVIDPSKFVRAYPEGMKGGYAKRVGNATILPVYNTDGAMVDKQQMIWIIRDNHGCRDFRVQGVGTGLTAP